MTRVEYERLRSQLDEELRAGIEMLHAGHHAKVAALEAQWREPPAEEVPASQPEASAPPPEPAAPAAEPRRARRLDGEVEADVEAALEQLGDVFQKSDLYLLMRCG